MALPFLPQGYAVRARRPDDDVALLRVENRAAQLFRDHGHPALADDLLTDVAELRALMEGHECWVCVDHGDVPVGCAVAGPRGAFLHLRELSVDPAHGRRGLGAALVGKVVDEARQRAFVAVSLTTFRDVPFNAPFYSRLGFVELPLVDAPPILRETFAYELPPGCAPATRLLMVRRT